MSGETVVVLISALVWWIPTFIGLSDLQNRQGLPRPVLWKWTAVLAVPVTTVGARNQGTVALTTSGSWTGAPSVAVSVSSVRG